MKNKLVFFKEMSTYGLAGVITQFSGVITTPIYTRYLSTEEYGVLDLLVTISTLLGMLLLLELQSGYSRSYYEAKKRTELGLLRGSVFIIYGVVFVFSLILFFSALPYLHQSDFAFQVDLLTPIVLKILPGMMISIAVVTFRMERNSKNFLLVSIVGLILTAVFGVVAVAILELGVSGILWSNLAASLVVAVIIAVIAPTNLRFAISGKYIKEVLHYSLPILPARAGTWINKFLGKIFIASALSLSLLGIFSISVKVALIMTLVISAFRQAWAPRAIEYFAVVNSEPRFAKALNAYFAAFLLMAILVTASSPLIVTILAPSSYYGAVPFVGIIALSVLWDGASTIVAAGNNWERRTYYNSYGSIISAVLSILLLYFFVEKGGVLAVSLTLLASSIVKSILILVTAQKNHAIPYSILSIALALFVTLVIAILSYWLFSSGSMSWPMSSGILILGGGILVYLYILTIHGKPSLVRLKNLLLPRNPS